MAIGQAVLVEQISANYNENLLPYFSTFNEEYTWNITSGSDAVIENSILRRASGDMSMLVTFTGTSETTFNATGTALQAIMPYDGQKKLSKAFWIDSDYEDAIVSFTTVVFIDGVATDLTTFQADINADEGFVFDKWNVFMQNLSIDKDAEVTFEFKVQSDTIGVKLFVDMFMLTIDDKKEGLVSAYKLPLKQNLIWQQRVDTTNTQNITADTETNLGFTGASESSDSITLLTTTGLITPTELKGAVSVDFYFDFDSPSGADKMVDVFLKVNSIIYRAETFTLSKSIGETEFVSGSFSLPVGTDFKTYGAQLSIKSTESITIENRYIGIIQHTKNAQ